MKLKELVREKCNKCGQRGKIISEEVYGCDNCKKEIDMSKPESDYLKLQVFYQIAGVDHLEFCSWKCLFKKAKKLKSDYFISLPFLHFDGKFKNGCQSKDFWKYIKI